MLKTIHSNTQFEAAFTDTDSIYSPHYLLFNVISGSYAYGLNQAHSDVDIRGIFVLPKEEYYGLQYTDQVADRKNDIIFYELKKMAGLLAKNNPNALELLLTPEDCILHRHPLMDKLPIELFLSKRCRYTFAGYALSQIKRAKGLNKKITNPMSEDRKSILDFCYIVRDNRSAPVRDFLEDRGWYQENCGLAKIPNIKGMYALYHDPRAGYEGIIREGEAANEIVLSSIPEEKSASALLFFNQDAYSTYCKSYREYWEWVEHRNEARYQDILSQGKRYDAKNMMHTFRLLHMAEEIATSGAFTVRRTIDRDFLLRIRKSELDYEDLVSQAEAKINRINELFDKSSLPDHPDLGLINQALIDIRISFYDEQ